VPGAGPGAARSLDVENRPITSARSARAAGHRRVRRRGARACWTPARPASGRTRSAGRPRCCWLGRARAAGRGAARPGRWRRETGRLAAAETEWEGAANPCVKISVQDNPYNYNMDVLYACNNPSTTIHAYDEAGSARNRAKSHDKAASPAGQREREGWTGVREGEGAKVRRGGAGGGGGAGGERSESSRPSSSSSIEAHNLFDLVLWM
jgi:hypothetical protein